MIIFNRMILSHLTKFTWVGAFFLYAVCSGASFAGSEQVTIDTTINNDSCKLSFTGADGGAVNLGAIHPSDFHAHGRAEMAVYHPVDIVLYDCGLGNKNTKPKIKLHGVNPVVDDVEDAKTDGPWMFRDKDSTSHGYFIFVASTADADWNGTTTPSKKGVYKNDSFITPALAADGSSKTTFYIGVGCFGTCSRKENYGGTVNSLLNFDVYYN